MKKKSSIYIRNFNSNLSILKKKNSKLAYQVQFADASALEFCKDKKKELNLKRDYQGHIYYYHSQEDVKQEAKEWFEKLQLNDSSVIFVYGIGLGYYYEASQEWLKRDKDRSLVFLEEDLGVLHRLLETRLGKKILKNSQIQIFYINSKLDDQEVLNELSWTYILCPSIISSLRLYQEVDPEGFSELSHRLSHALVQKKILVDEYLLYGIPFLRNFYPNLFELPKSYLGNSLFNQFKNVPAIICGAGPSLNKNIEFLKTLKNKALLFGGSSSLSALIAKNLIPHFGVGIDPNETQQVRIESIENHPIPFFYRNRFFHNALLKLKGPLLYLTGSGGYLLSEWFEKELGIFTDEEPLDEGHNVINFSLEIARAMGCNPIILVGVDLALTNEKHYAEGVKELIVQKGELDIDDELLMKSDIEGKPVKTYWKWITEAEWISNYAKEHTDITLINATEGGIGFKGVENRSLKEVARDYLKGEKINEKELEKKIKKDSLSRIKKKQVESLLNQFRKSLERCVTHFELIVQEMDNNLGECLEAASLETPLMAMHEGEIEQEIGYQYFLDTFNTIFLRLHHRLIQSLQGESKRVIKKKILLQKDRLNFLKDVSKVSVALISKIM